ncbi:MAG: dihydroorotate dehydrogenase electron transfer subunit [Prevotellaceae bacterium]|jgi:dihydroorotate dehydrogenase electron transfer subunit|nr:dihydroorotate dehydrogenase electron transfer subunit [Prevotellaceae bacterium]
MKKQISDFRVAENQLLNRQYFLLKIRRDEPLPPIFAGQFAQVRVDNSAETFLRRPISVNFVDYGQNEIWFLIKIAGKGTEKLSFLKKNDLINIIFPLGNGFSLQTNKNANLLLAGGGVGVAPLLYLGYTLKKQGFRNVNFLFGARTEHDLLLIEEFEQYGTLHFTTEDGSRGECGVVTQHSILKNEKFDFIYCCGPAPMMSAVAQYAETQNIDCEVSLENRMACGIGACLCCVTQNAEGKNVCVCTEGAVFNSKKLIWQI